MARGVRLKKSLNGSKSFGRRKSGDAASNGNDSYRKHRERGERKSLFTEKKFARRRGDSDVKEFGRKPSYGKQRGFARDDCDEETRSQGGNREMRGHCGRHEREGRKSSFTGENFPSRGGDSDVKEFGRKPSYRKQRGFGRDDCDEEMRSRGGNHEMRGHHGKRRDGQAERIPFRSEVIDRLRSRGKSMGRKLRDANGDDSKEVSRELRGDRRKKSDDSRSGRVYDRSEEMDGSVDSVEASSDKLRLKWKRMDKKRKDTDGDRSLVERTGRREKEDDNCQGKGRKMDKSDAKEALVGQRQRNKSEGGGDQVAENKPVRRQTRVLDKSGKKLRVAQKRSDDGSAEKDAPVKKKKRVIKIDPYDISNKRLDDSLPTGGHADTSEERDSEISKNAQFRAIQPSPAILSFVEDNLLGRRRLTELKDAGYNVKLSAPLDNVPFSTNTERERIEENVFRNKLEFFAAAKISSSFPPPVIPEIAFAGRSNVGKSSLLNALTRQWGVVRTSDKPGLTQTVNFFKLDTKLCLVDLPGYGFAYAKEEVKDAWEELVKEYVSTRVGLQRVCLLIDTKWGMKPRDHELIDLMERSRTPYQIVLTKTDLVFPIDVARRAMQIQENLKKNKSIINPVMMASSKSGAGVRNLRSVLAKITRFVKP